VTRGGGERWFGTDAQLRYILKWQEFTNRMGRALHRGKRKEISSADQTAALDEQVYDGPAVLGVGDERHPVRVRLTGHIDPIDGLYHWQGTIFDAPAVDGGVRLAVDGRFAPARITERTSWGSYSIAGVGAPPYPT
jgi:Domain of unknown function (DUF4873)